MPYIGNTAGNRFVASQAATRLSGNGSTTAFTLEHSVGSDEDILVSVDGVVQEPSIAYAVSNGTTLTFTAAPSNGTNNIFICYLFRTVATVDHPATSALTATSGTFSAGVSGTTGTFTGDLTVDTDTLKVDSTNDQVGINTATPSNYYSTSLVVTVPDEDGITIVGGETHRNYIMFADGTSGTNQYRGFIDYDHNTDTLNLGSGGGTRVELDGTGAMRNTFQPAFMAFANTQANVAVGSDVTVAFDNERFDQNSDFSTPNFTAPVTGKYQLNVSLYLENIDTASGYYYLELSTSNDNYYTIFAPSGLSADVDYWDLTISHVVDMDAGDTARVDFRQSHGTAQTDINANSFFSGYLVC